MNCFMSRLLAVCVCAAYAATVFGESKEVGSAREFATYCGTGSRYKKYDEIILTKDISLDSDITLKKNLSIRSKGDKIYKIRANNARQILINPGYKLVLENVIFDGESYSRRNEGLFYLEESSSTNKIACLELKAGAVIRNVAVTTDADADHAPVHVKKSACFIMNEGSAILNCANNSYHGNGGAICCDSGNVIINGGTIAGCKAKGSGGAIRATGTRIASADDHLGLGMRGDIFLCGGFITNNVCGEGSAPGDECFGGGIYLGETGPMLHVIGPVVVSNNVCKIMKSSVEYETIPDDVSTYTLEDDHANRLKLTGNQEGIKFTEGWVGVRYPDLRKLAPEKLESEIRKKRFGEIWEYETTTHEESRNFFWNGDNRYRGWSDGNALVWTRHKIYQLPLDRTTVKDVLLAADTNFPVYIEFNGGFVMNKDALGDSHIRVPNGLEVTFDLQGHSITCNLEVASGGRVIFCDSSTNRSGRVWGYRDVASDIAFNSPAYTNAYRIEGGSYRTKPDPAWIAPDRVVIGNYCEVHPWMVARLAWETNLTSRVADVTLVQLEDVDNEIRDVAYNAGTGRFDIDEICYSTGDWALNVHTNADLHVRVLVAPAVSNTVSGALEETGERIPFFDSGAGGILDNGNVSLPESDVNQNSRAPAFYGREDTFVWNAKSFGLVKMVHITYRKSGTIETTNAVESCYFRFPEAALMATQRKTNGDLPIVIVDSLLNALGYDRASGFLQDDVNENLNGFQANGLRKWENIVTGTAEHDLLASTAKDSGGGLKLSVSLVDSEKLSCTSTGYSVMYDLRKSTSNGWERVGDVRDTARFEVDLLDEDGASKNASGFYRVTTLIVPDCDLSVTNEIPSTNIVGVLEVASALTNTLTAVPWTALGDNSLDAEVRPVTVSNYVHTPHLCDGDSVQVAENGLYRKWNWNKNGKIWSGAITVTYNGVVPAVEASEQSLQRNSAVWVIRNDPAAKPFFLIGQYSDAPIALRIEGGTADSPVCTLVPNPSLEAVKVNDYNWNEKPVDGDIIRIPNEKKAPLVLRWKNGEWGRLASGKWKNDTEIPAGTGFWYMRCGEAFDMVLPNAQLNEER